MIGQSEFKPLVRILSTLCSTGFTRGVIPVEGAPMKSSLAGAELVSSLCWGQLYNQVVRCLCVWLGGVGVSSVYLK